MIYGERSQHCQPHTRPETQYNSTTHPVTRGLGLLLRQRRIGPHLGQRILLGDLKTRLERRARLDSINPSAEQGEVVERNSRPVVRADPT